ATGDVNGDSFDDIITAAGPGGGPHVKVFDGRTGAEMMSFYAFAPDFLGGVSVGTVVRSFSLSTLDEPNPVQDMVFGTGPGVSSQVKVVPASDGGGQLTLAPFEGNFLGGTFVG